MSLVQKFQAIESVLQFHHSTNTRPLLLEEVVERVHKLSGLRITLETLREILDVFPDSYMLEQADKDSSWRVSASSLPHKAKERRDQFTTLLGTRSLPSPPPTPTKLHKPVLPRIMGKTPSRVIKGTLKPVSTNVPKQGDILTRIRMKEAALKRAQDPTVIRLQREKFLTAQLPNIAQVLRSLASGQQSFAMNEIIDRITTSMKTRLSAREISDAVQLLAKSRPNFCSLVESGAITVVKLSPMAY